MELKAALFYKLTGSDLTWQIPPNFSLLILDDSSILDIVRRGNIAMDYRPDLNHTGVIFM
ncbi:hypothetical protein HW132_34710 [Brasilonema sp. CT11]|nr:hypothetical protein [Brasilonema sp. CT11]